MKRTAIAIAFVIVYFANPASAQQGIPAEAEKALSSGSTPRAEFAIVRPARVVEAPRIDGILDEPMWAEIEPITELTQYEPDNGALPTERTEVRFGYDDEFLYVGIRAYDSDPERLIARSYERDRGIDQDDSIFVTIDSLNNNRTAIGFGTNLLGTKSDMELSEDRSLNMAYDTIWYTESNIDEFGYTMEFAIPFFSLRFQPADVIEMGVNIERYIRRKNELAIWPPMSRDFSYFSVSQYASMQGLESIERGVNLEIKPYGIGGYNEVPEEKGWEGDAGLDVKWGITPNLTADVTVNPDFAQVESDDLRINLTRFNLFFPEKRDFFLESADLFKFGLPREVEVFFSRRIGIIGNQEVPIYGGVRTYGLVGNTNLGLMTMQTRPTDFSDSENFSVVRVKQNVLGRSYVGGIFTSRQGGSTFEDTTLGGDFQFRFGVNTLVQASVARSHQVGDATVEPLISPDRSSTSDWFINASAQETKDLYDWIVRYTDVGERFEPGIGFVQRHDQRALMTNVHYKPRPGWRGVRQLYFGFNYRRVEDHDRVLETQIFRPGFLALFQSEDTVTILFFDIFERVRFPFFIGPGVAIPAGDYRQNQVSLDVSSNPARRWSVSWKHLQGGFYDGDILSTSLTFRFSPVSQVRLTTVAQYDDVTVPAGVVESLIARLYVSYYFSPELTTRAAVQYSSLYEDFVANFRVRWIYTPGSEAWFVYDEGRRFGLVEPSLRDRAVIFKLVHNFHF
jgi:hypothetical protein